MLRSSVLLVLNILQLVFTELSVRHDHFVYSQFTPEQFDTDLPQQCIKYYIRLREPVRYVLPHASISIIDLQQRGQPVVGSCRPLSFGSPRSPPEESR